MRWVMDQGVYYKCIYIYVTHTRIYTIQPHVTMKYGIVIVIRRRELSFSGARKKKKSWKERVSQMTEKQCSRTRAWTSCSEGSMMGQGDPGLLRGLEESEISLTILDISSPEGPPKKDSTFTGTFKKVFLLF